MCPTPWTGPIKTPRRWQAQALTAILAYLEAPATERGRVICAVMGAGKSILQGELTRLALAQDPAALVVIVAPTAALVTQLKDTVAQVTGQPVSQFDGRRKDTTCRVIVTSTLSLKALAMNLTRRRKAASLLIVDECHRSEARKCLEGAALLDAPRSLGFSATPFRASLTERLSLFSGVLYSYGIAEALDDGVLVPPRFHHWTDDQALVSGIDGTDVDAVCLHWLKSAPRPVLVSASSCADADTFAATVREDNPTLRVEVVHGRRPAELRARSMARAKRAALDVLVHVNMLAEGVDIPALRSLIMRRKVSSAIRYPQEVGRVLRSAPGKARADIYDPHAVSTSFSLAAEARLWAPRAAAVLLPSDPAQREALERWTTGQDFTGLHPTHDFEALCAAVVADKLRLAVVHSPEALTETQRQRLQSLPSMEWDAKTPLGEPASLRILWVIPPTASRFVVTALRLDDETTGVATQREAMERWLKLTGKDPLAEASCKGDAAQQREGLRAVGLFNEGGLFDAGPTDGLPVVVFNRRLLDAGLVDAIRDDGRRLIELAPDRRVVAAVTLSPRASWLSNMATTLELMGLCEPWRVAAYVRARPMTAKQEGQVRNHTAMYKGWALAMAEEDRDAFRDALLSALAMRLDVGEASDLLSIITSAITAGEWPLQN